ncbi:MAG: protein kinase domain-containing protein [Myxococcota bacterium]
MSEKTTGNVDEDHQSESDPATDPDAPTLRMDDSSPSPSTPSGAASSTELEGAELLAERYELLGLVGRGGMGNVYRARDLELDEIVALKTLERGLMDNERAVAQFRREVKLARRVTHQNVARTYDIGSEGDILFLTMEYVEGRPMSELLREEAPVEPREGLEIVEQICDGLQAAHDAEVLHRDLKPQNVMLRPDGRALLTDFGIARAARRGETQFTVADGPVGTPAYMAPEQVEGKRDLDGRIDIYALGVMMFEMLTGKLPWTGETVMAMALARVLNEPPRLDEHGEYPKALTELVWKAMARHRDERFASVENLREAMRTIDKQCKTVAPTRRLPPSADGTPTMSGRVRRETSNLSAVAVLPFRNRGESEDAYLAEGFTEELIDELSMFDRLRLRPLGAVTQYATQTPDPGQVGRDLDVNVVVDGSLRKVGGRLRIRVSVTSVSDGFQIWSGKFTGEPSGLFELTEQAAEAVADALTSERADERLSQPHDTVAIDLYMRGRYEMHRGWHINMETPISLFERALQRAPKDARILTGLATARARKAFMNPGESARHLREAREVALEAIESAPDWADPYFALAMVEFNAEKFGPAVQNCLAALRYQEEFADAHDLLGRILSETGPLDRAAYHLERAMVLNPSLHRARWDLARVYAFQGEWEKSDISLGEPPDEFEGSVAHFLVRTRLDTWRDTPMWMEEDIPDLPDVPVFFDAVSVNRRMLDGEEMTMEDFEILWRRAERVEADGRRKALSFQVATEFACLNELRDEAYKALRAAIGAGLNDHMWISHCPALELIRGEREFSKLEARLAGRVDAARRALTQRLQPAR